MKPKLFHTKLVLNKKTISNLDNGEMNALQGGGTRTFCAYSDDDVSCYIISCDLNKCNDIKAFTNDDISCPQVTCCL